LKIEQSSGGTFVVHFEDVEFYAKFKHSVTERYPRVDERHHDEQHRLRQSRASSSSSRRSRHRQRQPDRQVLEADADYDRVECDDDDNDNDNNGDNEKRILRLVVNGEGDHVVTLTFDNKSRTLTVGGDGAMAWVMRDMQAIYRSVTVVQLLPSAAEASYVSMYTE
jgi:hypothetical protein